MPKTIKVAAVQMDTNPAPAVERLACAEQLIMQAAQAGAQLVVLPELSYFRGRRGSTVAHTELGDLGMMIC